MKKMCLSILLLIAISPSSFSQQREPFNHSLSIRPLNMKDFLDSMHKKKQGLLLEGLKPNEYPTQQTVSELMAQLPNNRINLPQINHVMPVLSPDSDYVFNMPGTHAFDKSKAKGGIFFVSEHPVILKDCFKKPEYFDLQKNSLAPEQKLIPIKK